MQKKTLINASLPSFFILFLVCIIIFSPLLETFFMIDYIDLLNALFHKNEISTCFKHPFIMSFRFRPIESMQFFLSYNLFGLNPEGYFVFLIVFFIIGLIALYYLLLVIFRNKILCFIPCFLIAVHPLNFELISIFSCSFLAFSFFTSALLCYLLSLRKEKKAAYFYILSLALYAMAVFTREDTLILPLFVLIYHALSGDSPSWGAVAKRLSGFLSVIAAYLAVRFLFLGLWISSQKDFPYNFSNLGGVMHNYKMFSILAFKLITNPFAMLYNLDLYFHNLMIFKNTIIIFSLSMLILFVAMDKWIGLVQSFHYKEKIRAFFLGLLWYLAALLPYVFISDNKHFNIHYLLIPMIGMSIVIAIIIVEAHSLIYPFNKYLANGILFFVIVTIFSTSLLISRRINKVKIDKRYNYFGYVDLGVITEKCITAIKAKYDTFPAKSRIYFIDFPVSLRIQTAVPIFYGDKTMKTFLLKEEKLKTLSLIKKDNTFVFRFTKDKQVEDLTDEYRRQESGLDR